MGWEAGCYVGCSPVVEPRFFELTVAKRAEPRTGSRSRRRRSSDSRYGQQAPLLFFGESAAGLSTIPAVVPVLDLDFGSTSLFFLLLVSPPSYRGRLPTSQCRMTTAKIVVASLATMQALGRGRFRSGTRFRTSRANPTWETSRFTRTSTAAGE